MNIGERIKEIRISKGLTQAELSEKSGIALRTVQRIERNEGKPSLYSIKAMENALGVQLYSELFADENRKFEFKIVISNLTNLLDDFKLLIKSNWKIIFGLSIVVSILFLYQEIKSAFFYSLDDTKLSVRTINCGKANECDIELIKKDVKGKVLWKRIIGGTSYDKAGQAIKTKDGNYLVVGSTSSFGKGNYDVLLVKVSPSGDILWQKTYGEFLNDYGLKISSGDDDLYLIEATKQICSTFNVSNDCFDQEWLFSVDEAGNIK